jgi:hypothetical protein
MCKISFLFWAVLSSISMAGNGAGGGTDSHVDVKAWFLGPSNKISSCLKLSPQFGVDENTAIKEIKAAYQTWGNYLKEKNVQWDMGSIPMMTTQIDLHVPCTGQEDLTFYFGTEDALVTKLKKHYLAPYGFAERLSYDEDKGWGKGIIWIALPNAISSGNPNWTQSNTLKGILIHEIGHTLGTGHVSKTIMTENFYRLLQNASGQNDWMLTHVDHMRELHFCRKCGYEFIASEGTNIYHYLADSFLRLTGTPPKGTVQGRFSMRMENKTPRGTITYQDDKGSHSFDLNAPVPVTRGEDSAPVFRADIGMIGNMGTSRSFSYYGTLSNGAKSWNVIVNRNFEGRLDIVEAATGKTIFWAVMVNEHTSQ